MAITTAMATSFKVQLMKAEHNMKASGGHSLKIALYTSSATLGASTTAYSATNEISGTGYSAGGTALTNVDPTSSGTTAYWDAADPSWTTSTFTARGALIYNDTHASDAAISSHDFGSDKSVSGGTFQITFPAADASNAVIRIA